MVADITSVTTRGDILETTPESYDRLMNVNLRGPFFLTQRVAAGFVANQKDGRYRCIVNISSAKAFAASINREEYRLEERRGGNERVRTCRSGGVPNNK